VDFARNNSLLTWYLGGLNLQIEHHLFPRICHVHYRSIADIVEETSSDFGIRYTAHDGFFRAVASHWRWLRRMGRAPEPRAPSAPIDEGHAIHVDYRFDAERPDGHPECT
jgi:linoleoyl-CoA desaturase